MDKMNFPKISIVVPSYNQGQFLEETILSIIYQEYPNLELFVVDGGSSDNSIDIIKKYEQHISWWVSEKDKGQSDAINKGLKKISGDIVSWINSDDLLTLGTLNNVAEYFSKLPSDVGLIHGGTTVFNDKKEIKDDWGYSNPSLERNLAGMAFSQPSAFFLKKYLDMVGGKLNEQLHYGMDYDLFSRLACVCNFVPVKEIFSKYRLHEHSKSVQEQHKFINDWNRTFVNLCRNLEWNDVLSEIDSAGVLDEQTRSYYSPFFFQVNDEILKNINKKQTLFYHFCYIVKSSYLSGDRKKTRKLVSVLKKNFPRSWLENEKHIPQILLRLKLPEFLLGFLTTLKQSYQNLAAKK
jgi:glycosyltransferase involved in cell wall biosynthesis